VESAARRQLRKVVSGLFGLVRGTKVPRYKIINVLDRTPVIEEESINVSDSGAVSPWIGRLRHGRDRVLRVNALHLGPNTFKDQGT
jgi:hypothetical protein